MALFAKPIVFILYGKEFLASANILRVAVWYITFSYYGSVRSVWILAENKQKYLFGINVTGAIANIFLNYLLIPNYGAVGAAMASFITQFFTNVVIGFVFKPIRRNNYLMIKGLNPRIMIDLCLTVLRKSAN
jgi:O-antigen/teichoic acid export membrane protein